MTLKAVKITKDNKDSLEAQYAMDDGFLEYSSGMFLIADFGATTFRAIRTPSGFAETYLTTGKILENGYFEVMLRS